MILPDIPGSTPPLAEWLACLLYVLALPRRFGRGAAAAISTVALAVLGVFLHLTGDVPLVW